MSRQPARQRRRCTDQVTPRELEIIAAVLAAGSEKAAAHQLGLAPSTVKNALANARSKCGVTTTVQLVWILRLRLPGRERVVLSAP